MAAKILDVATNLLAELCGWFLLIVMSLITIDLVSRALSTPIYGVSESAMFVMIAIVYLGLPYAERIQAHVRVELLLDHLPPRVSAVIDLIMYLLVSATMLVVLYAVILNAKVAYENKQAVAGTTPLLIWPVKFVMVAAMALYVVRILINVYHAFQKVSGSGDAATGEY